MEFGPLFIYRFGRWFQPGFCTRAGNSGGVAEKVSSTVAFKRSHLGPITNHRYIDRGKCLGVALGKHAVGCACFICLNLIGSWIFPSSLRLITTLSAFEPKRNQFTLFFPSLIPRDMWKNPPDVKERTSRSLILI